MPLALIFDTVGFGEWFVLLAVVLIIVGPKKLPSVARQIGAMYGKFRRKAEVFKRELMDMDREVENEVNRTFTIDGDEADARPYIGMNNGDKIDTESERA